MGFFDSTARRVAVGWGTGGLSEVYRAMRPGGGGQGYAPLPYENPDFAVDDKRVSRALQWALGRAPTKNEVDQYSKYVKTGDLDYGEIGQIAQGLPEADRARLDQYAAQYGDVMGANDQKFLSQAADTFGAKVNSQFASLGRPNTSAMGAQVFAQGGQLAGQLAQRRQYALAAFYGQGLQNNMDAYRDQGASALSRGQGLRDSRTAYNRGLNGYQTQRSDYGVDLANEEAKNRQRAYSQLGGSLVGAGVGGLIGGRTGAQIGAGVGGRAGGLF